MLHTEAKPWEGASNRSYTWMGEKTQSHNAGASSCANTGGIYGRMGELSGDIHGVCWDDWDDSVIDFVVEHPSKLEITLGILGSIILSNTR